MWTAKFWTATAERTIRTFAQALLALIGTNVVAVTDLDWPQMLLVATTAAIVAVLTAIVATGVGDPQSPSLLKD